MKKAFTLAFISFLAAAPIAAFAANQAPYWSEWNFFDFYTAVVGRTLQFSVLAVDPDGNNLTYSAVNLPAGASFEHRTFTWTPSESQIGRHFFTVRASDGVDTIEKQIEIKVVGDGGSSTDESSRPRDVSGSRPQIKYVPIEKKVFVDRVVRVPEPLKIINLVVSTDEEGNVTVSWETNKASKGRVIYGTESQQDKEKDFTYTNTTPESKKATIAHKITLTDLKTNNPYFLRAVAKTDSETAVSREVMVIRLPGGGIKITALASITDALGSLLRNNPVISTLIFSIIIFGSLIYLRWRKDQILR